MPTPDISPKALAEDWKRMKQELTTPDTSNANVALALRDAASVIEILNETARTASTAPLRLFALADALDARPDVVEQIRREERERYNADREHMALRIRQAESAARELLEKLSELTALKALPPIILQVPDAPPAVTWEERVERAMDYLENRDRAEVVLRAAFPEVAPTEKPTEVCADCHIAYPVNQVHCTADGRFLCDGCADA